MIPINEHCGGSIALLATMCSKSTEWSAVEYCQLSCYEAGYKYSGESCCKEFENPSIIQSCVPGMVLSTMPSIFQIAYPSQEPTVAPSLF